MIRTLFVFTDQCGVSRFSAHLVIPGEQHRHTVEWRQATKSFIAWTPPGDHPANIGGMFVDSMVCSNNLTPCLLVGHYPLDADLFSTTLQSQAP
jgi:hypothetical protein